MTETKNPGEKLSVAPTKTLTLKRGVEQGVVRQSFSHGRTKPVVVEKVKRRVIGAESKPEPAAPAPAATPEKTPGQRATAAKTATTTAAAASQGAAAKPSGVVLRTLSEEER